MRYFDFHTHVLFKQIFDEVPNVDARINQDDVGGIPQMCTSLPFIIQSQIHQSQLAEYGEEVITGVVLYGLESYLAEEVVPLRRFLKSSSQHKLSEALLNDVASNTVTSFSQFTLAGTLNRYINDSTSFNILKKSSFNSPLPRNKVNIFFVVEGCHSLVDTHNKYVPPNELFPPQEILANLDTLLAKVKIISINPTHLQQSNLCNHAFGMQLTRVDKFLPSGNGLQNDGRDVIQGIFDRGICVDLKHMSFKSRWDLMREIEAGQFQNVQPLVCTHTGFTGIRFSEWPGFIFNKKLRKGAFYIETAKSMQVRNEPQRPGAPTFNSTTINLFDEEIAWIVRNGGIIGISMDRRIIGYVDQFDEEPTGDNSQSDLIVDKEWISKNEWNSLNISNSQLGTRINPNDCLNMADLQENLGGGTQARNEYFSDHVLLHIKHFFQACVNDGISIATAQKHITFGTDFDGLINPFMNIDTVEEMATLKTYISASLSVYLENLLDSKQWVGQLNIPQFIEDLFYNNGFNFIKSRM